MGLGEDGLQGLSPASLKALKSAQFVMGARRHLALLPDLPGETIEWPVPFADGLPILHAKRGTPTVVLASGNPFWFGAGSVITRDLEGDEWHAIPGFSVFTQAAARLGWPLETTLCLGLHAAPLTRLRPHLSSGQLIILTVRDGSAVGELASYLVAQEFGATKMTIMESLAGPRERIRDVAADAFNLSDVAHPVAVALIIAGPGATISAASGKPDDIFETDGQITKRPIRALTLSTLAARPGETLWDLGAGSGSIAIEWLMTHPSTQACAVEVNPDRAALVRKNANALGQDRLSIVTGKAREHLHALPKPNAVFVGGGLSNDLLDDLWAICPPGTRIVANAVTLETEALLTHAHAERGGDLMRIEISETAPIGRYRGWKAAYPLVQWSVTR